MEVGLLEAQFHMLSGEMAEATSTLKRLAQSNADAIEPRLILGQMALQEARFGDARGHLQAARAVHPDHPEVLHLLALAPIGRTLNQHLLSVLG